MNIPMTQRFCKRNDYQIDWEIDSQGTYVYNKLEDCEYTTNEEQCVILTGTVGEQWVTSIAKFLKTYEVDESTVYEGASGYAYPRSEGGYIYARPAQGEEEVATSWGSILTANLPGREHGNGDWVVCASDDWGDPNYDDQWIVNGAVFETTYMEY